jgi:hypothetical protein
LDEAYDRRPKQTEGIVPSKWAETFLNTKGYNFFSGKIEGNQLIITQEVTDHSDGLRQQKLDVLLFDEKFNEEVVSFLSSEEEAVSKIILKYPKKYFILDHGDHAYCKTLIDDSTIEFLGKNLKGLKNNLDRALVWRSIEGMIKTLRLKSTTYFDFVAHNLPYESQNIIIEKVLETCHNLLYSSVPESQFGKICSDTF